MLNEKNEVRNLSLSLEKARQMKQMKEKTWTQSPNDTGTDAVFPIFVQRNLKSMQLKGVPVLF